MPITIRPSRTTGIYGDGSDPMGTLFSCPIYWIVTVANSGFIVQHIQRNEKYRAKVRGGEVDVVSAHDYWEAWEIDGGGVARPRDNNGVNDNFGLYRHNSTRYRGNDDKTFPSKEGTRGRWKIRGTVYYVPDVQFQRTEWYRAMDPATNSFVNEPRGVRSAGKLLSRFDPPVGGDGLVVGASLGRAMVTRQFAGTWDWTRNPAVSASRRWPLGGNFDSAIGGYI